MNSTLAEACWALFYLIAPGLLVGRYFWPRVLPRWAVLILAGGLAGTVFYLHQLLNRTEMMKFAQTSGVLDLNMPPLADGMVQLHGARLSDFMLGVALGYVYLLLWLVPYGTIQILRNRRRQSMQVTA